MSITELSTSYVEHSDFTSVSLPYEGDSVRAILVLPSAKEPDAASKLALVLGLQWNTLRPVTYPGHKKVNIFLPRFKLSHGVADLATSLKQMGLGSAFLSGRGFFLSMIADDSVAISALLHKAVLEVNEEGTVAAAATSVMMAQSLQPAPPPELTLRFDRPFIFVIEHIESQELLFAG